MINKTDGFTLIELMVGILCSALVTGAIITFMLMGTNTTRSVMDANADQRNAKIVISMMENLASEGSISSVEYVGDASEGDDKQDWTILDNTSSPILSYSASSQSLRGRKGAVLMEGVLGSSVSLSEQKNLLTFNIKTELNNYKSSVYCRTVKIETPDNLTEEKIEAITDNKLNALNPSSVAVENRIGFLQTMYDQLGSTGEIRDGSGKTYTLWYCGGDAYYSGWDANTPWCATFLSWAIDKNSGNLSELPREANVDNLWSEVPRINTSNSPDNVLPGDLVFFDWDLDTKSADNTDLEHVGVVLYIQNGWVYTIEGNSGDRVAIRRYDWDDPSIYSYGRLHWTGETISNS